MITKGLSLPIANPYVGNSTSELKSLRESAAEILQQKFPKALVDAKPGKSIEISGGSLLRTIDVIVGNWWDTELYKQSKSKVFRGINILDSKVPEEIRNKPFLHNYRINEKDEKTGGLRKVIRLLKTLKYDAEPELSMSSYDIAAVAYNMSEPSLTVAPGSYVALAKNALAELKRFIQNQAVRESLLVPNQTRTIFGGKGATLESLKALAAELEEALGSFRKLASASIIEMQEQFNFSSGPAWTEIRPPSVKAHMF